MSEVSEESAFEEEDEDYFAADPTTNGINQKTSKDGNKLLLNESNTVKFKEDLVNGEEEIKQ